MSKTINKTGRNEWEGMNQDNVFTEKDLIDSELMTDGVVKEATPEDAKKLEDEVKKTVEEIVESDGKTVRVKWEPDSLPKEIKKRIIRHMTVNSFCGQFWGPGEVKEIFISKNNEDMLLAHMREFGLRIIED